MTEFKRYYRRQIAELRPYEEGESMRFVSVSLPDQQNGSPRVGDMIARNPKDHSDQWLVAEKYFKENFEPVPEPDPNLIYPGKDPNFVFPEEME